MFKDVLGTKNFMGEDTPLVIDVVDNGGQWTHREWRMLKYLKVDTQIIPNDTPVDQLRELDGLILSGGAARIASGELGNCAEFLKLEIPILGICAGHQFMARFYGGDARESPIPEFGAMEIQLHDGGGKIFAGTSETQTVWESHNDEVHVVPEGFFVTASSPSCEVQGMENDAGSLRFAIPSRSERFRVRQRDVRKLRRSLPKCTRCLNLEIGLSSK